MKRAQEPSVLAPDTDRKTAGPYIFSTTIALLLPDALSIWLESIVVKEIWKAMMQGYSGWSDLVMLALGYIEMSASILMGYLFVVVLSFKRIKKIPMDETLKSIE